MGGKTKGYFDDTIRFLEKQRIADRLAKLRKLEDELAMERHTLALMEIDIIDTKISDIVKLNYKSLLPEKREKIKQLESQLEKLRSEKT